MKELNPEIDTTKFVNIDDKKFVFHINKQPREIEAGEEKVMPVYVAQIGAKHLVDRILQEKHNVKDTLRDSDLRKSLFAQILPEMAEDRDIKPLSENDFNSKVEEELKRQNDLIGALAGKTKEKDDKILKLETKIEELNRLIGQEKKRLGRPPKVEKQEGDDVEQEPIDS